MGTLRFGLRLSGLAVMLLLLSKAVLAQEWGASVGTGERAKGEISNFYLDHQFQAVLSEPYSAVRLTTWSQKQAGGKTRAIKTPVRVARDASGRTYERRPGSRIG